MPGSTLTRRAALDALPFVLFAMFSLAVSVVELVDAIQAPVPTTAVRLILGGQGRSVTAEQLGTLAAYERQDYGEHESRHACARP
jgi:hypothetical protein